MFREEYEDRGDPPDHTGNKARLGEREPPRKAAS
jgi:hypothetical protein